MTYPTRNNPYSFEPFLEWRNAVDYYADDPFFQKLVRAYTGDLWERVDAGARIVSKKASFRWRDMAESAARPEERPYVLHYDGHNRRIDRIVRPAEILQMEREIFGEGLFSVKTHPWEKLVKMFIIYQNGEACVACPMTCTEGLVALLARFADTKPVKDILNHCREGIDGEFAIGAQYLSEIQGGSDVPSNVLEAEETGGVWRLYGTKFFCSATHAEYAVVTAKPKGSESVALFVVPSWMPGNRGKEIRNGYTIDRIKWKMGTSELTTAELTFNGAVAYPVGPLDRGVANVVGIVLTYSRLTVGLSASAFMTRAAREAARYAEFRDAFGLTIGRFPMLAGQVRAMEHAARRTVAGAFAVYDLFLSVEGSAGGGPEEKKKRFDARELIMLQKIAASWDAVEVIRNAMSVFGGHGVMEDFSSLPRLYRDSAVNELWEGPRNVLLTQMHRDFQKAAEWYPPSEFVSRVLGAGSPGAAEIAAEMTELVAHPSLFTMDEKTIEVCGRWDALCHRLMHACQDRALERVQA